MLNIHKENWWYIENEKNSSKSRNLFAIEAEKSCLCFSAILLANNFHDIHFKQTWWLDRAKNGIILLIAVSKSLENMASLMLLQHDFYSIL